MGATTLMDLMVMLAKALQAGRANSSGGCVDSGKTNCCPSPRCKGLDAVE